MLVLLRSCADKCGKIFSGLEKNVVDNSLYCPPPPRLSPCPGVVPDASPGEFAHQQSKSGNKSNCGRDPPEHFMVRANTIAATLTLADGLEYKVRTTTAGRDSTRLFS